MADLSTINNLIDYRLSTLPDDMVSPALNAMEELREDYERLLAKIGAVPGFRNVRLVNYWGDVVDAMERALDDDIIPTINVLTRRHDDILAAENAEAEEMDEAMARQTSPSSY